MYEKAVGYGAVGKMRLCIEAVSHEKCCMRNLEKDQSCGRESKYYFITGDSIVHLRCAFHADSNAYYIYKPIPENFLSMFKLSY